MTSVLWTSTTTPTAGSTRDSSSMARVAWKKVPPAPPWTSGTSMPMTPSVEERPQQVAIERLLLVHGPRERGDAVHREFADAVAEEPLVVGERRKGRGRNRGCVDRLGHGLRGIMAEACSNARGEVHVLRFAARASPDRRTHRRVGDADPRAVGGARPDPGTAGPAACGPDATAAASPGPDATGTDAARARCSGRGAAGCAAWRRAADARLPHRHQLRPRRRAGHRQQGQRRREPDPGRLRGLRGQQAAEGRELPLHQGRGQPARRRAAPADPHDLGRGDRARP